MRLFCSSRRMASGTGLGAGVGTGRALFPDSRWEKKEELEVKRSGRWYIMRDFFRFSWSAGFPSLVASLPASVGSGIGVSVEVWMD